MLKNVMCSVAVILSVAALAMADAKEDVINAAKKVADASGYSWKTVSEMGGNTFESTGKSEKDGYTMLSMQRQDNNTEVYLKGDKGVIKTDDGWKTLEEASQNAEGFMRFLPRIIQSFRSPAHQAEQAATNSKELTSGDGGVVSGELTEDGARELMSFGRRGGQAGQAPPQIKNPKATVKFWTRDGMLSKYELHFTGTRVVNGDEQEIDRTTTTEISDVGSTKMTVPEEAKKKLES